MSEFLAFTYNSVKSALRLYFEPLRWVGKLFRKEDDFVLGRFFQLSQATRSKEHRPSLREDRWRRIGGSFVKRRNFPSLEPVLTEPQFKTLQVTTIKVSKAKWRFKIRFTFYNCTVQEIALYDMHVIKYHVEVPTPPRLTLGYRGEVVLSQDNTLWIGGQSWHLKPGEGFEVVLVLEMTRIEGSHIYGTDHERPGMIRCVFGLFCDYSVESSTGVSTKSVPSDCVYLCECRTASDEPQLHAINRQKATHYEWLRPLLEKHLSSRPTPVP